MDGAPTLVQIQLVQIQAVEDLALRKWVHIIDQMTDSTKHRRVFLSVVALVLQLYLLKAVENGRESGPEGRVDLPSFRGLKPPAPSGNAIYNCSTGSLWCKSNCEEIVPQGLKPSRFCVTCGTRRASGFPGRALSKPDFHHGLLGAEAGIGLVRTTHGVVRESCGVCFRRQMQRVSAASPHRELAS